MSGRHLDEPRNRRHGAAVTAGVARPFPIRSRPRQMALRTALAALAAACADGTSPEAEMNVVCGETASVTFDWSTGTHSGSFCAAGTFAYWTTDPGEADAVSWAHALKRGDERWILIVAYSPAERGAVDRFALLLPSRRFGVSGQSGLWRGPYNLACAASIDPAADDCWGLEDIGYCLSSADPEEQALLPDCLAGWPRGMAIVHRVGYIAGEGPSDEGYEFQTGVVTLDAEVTMAGQLLSGTFEGTMREVVRHMDRDLVITGGRFRLVLRTSPFHFSSLLL
jgi:hypothetical protein